MPTKNENAAATAQAAHEEFEAALREYSTAIEELRKGEVSEARSRFEKVRAASAQEPELSDRAATYIRICDRKLAPAAAEPSGKEGLYRAAVIRLNEGDIDGALQCLNRALAEDPTSIDLLYVRACAWAKQGSAEKAVGDLRQAIAADPKVRFQAVNDPDFERIREEPAFIDIIEPTPTGA